MKPGLYVHGVLRGAMQYVCLMLYAPALFILGSFQLRLYQVPTFEESIM